MSYTDFAYINHTCPNCGTPVSFEIDMGDFPKIIIHPCPECEMDVVYDHDNGQEFYETICDHINSTRKHWPKKLLKDRQTMIREMIKKHTPCG